MRSSFMDLLHKCGSQSYRSVVSRSVEAVSHDLLTDPERCTDEIGVSPPCPGTGWALVLHPYTSGRIERLAAKQGQCSSKARRSRSWTAERTVPLPENKLWM